MSARIGNSAAALSSADAQVHEDLEPTSAKERMPVGGGHSVREKRRWSS